MSKNNARRQPQPPAKPHNPAKGQPDPRLLNTAPNFTSPADVKRAELERLGQKLGKRPTSTRSVKPLVHDGYLVINPVRYMNVNGRERHVKPYDEKGNLTVVRDMGEKDLFMSLDLGSIEPNMVEADQVGYDELPEHEGEEADHADELDGERDLEPSDLESDDDEDDGPGGA